MRVFACDGFETHVVTVLLFRCVLKIAASNAVVLCRLPVAGFCRFAREGGVSNASLPAE